MNDIWKDFIEDIVVGIKLIIKMWELDTFVSSVPGQPITDEFKLKMFENAKYWLEVAMMQFGNTEEVADTFFELLTERMEALCE